MCIHGKTQRCKRKTFWTCFSIYRLPKSRYSALSCAHFFFLVLASKGRGIQRMFLFYFNPFVRNYAHLIKIRYFSRSFDSKIRTSYRVSRFALIRYWARENKKNFFCLSRVFLVHRYVKIIYLYTRNLQITTVILLYISRPYITDNNSSIYNRACWFGAYVYKQ